MFLSLKLDTTLNLETLRHSKNNSTFCSA